MIKATVRVTFKPGILDPQGRAIRQSLRHLGFSRVDEVRTGKVLEIEFDERDPAAVDAQLKAMCDTLLANPVIEDYRYDVEGRPAPASGQHA